MLSEKISKRICNNLYSKIPEFKIHVDEFVIEGFHENSYLVFGPLGGLLNDFIINDQHSMLIKSIFNFINNLCDEGNTDIENMLKVTFFERLTDHQKTIAYSKVELRDRALYLFNEVLNNPIFRGGLYG